MRACRRRTTLFWCYVNGLQYHVPVYPQDLLALNLTIFAGTSSTNAFLKEKENWHFSWNSGRESQIFQPSFSSKVQYIMKNAKGGRRPQPPSIHPIPKLQLFYENFFFLVDQGPCIKNHFGPNKTLQKILCGERIGKRVLPVRIWVFVNLYAHTFSCWFDIAK